MTVLLAFAFLSGVITILSPCILPVLPIVLAGGGSGGKGRPFGVISGFIVSFSFFTLALSTIVQALGVPADTLRYVAMALIVLFGIVMVVPRFRELFDVATSRIASGGSRAAAKPRAGFWGGIPVGLSLGLVWTPCVGPIMASVISLALAQKVDGGSVLVTVAYTLGTAIPMLAIMLGGRALIAKAPALSRNAGTIQRAFGVVMILMGVALAFQWDRADPDRNTKAVPFVRQRAHGDRECRPRYDGAPSEEWGCFRRPNAATRHALENYPGLRETVTREGRPSEILYSCVTAAGHALTLGISEPTLHS